MCGYSWTVLSVGNVFENVCSIRPWGEHMLQFGGALNSNVSCYGLYRVVGHNYYNFSWDIIIAGKQLVCIVCVYTCIEMCRPHVDT